MLNKYYIKKYNFILNYNIYYIKKRKYYVYYHLCVLMKSKGNLILWSKFKLVINKFKKEIHFKTSCHTRLFEQNVFTLSIRI